MVSLLFLITIVQITAGQVNFVAVGADQTRDIGRNIAYSMNGINWTVVTTNIFSEAGDNVAYSAVQNKWIAVGEGTVNTMAWSPNGITWTGLGLNCFTTIGKGVHYSAQQNRWVAVGNGPNSIWYSTDGFSWTVATIGIITTQAKAVTYSSSLNQWVAVGLGTNTIATSPDGITWTGRGNILFGNGGLSIRFGGGTYVVTGNDATTTQAWSTDGITWTGTPEFISNSRQDSVYAQGKWILVGAGSNNFQNSTDGGRSWTTQPNFIAINSVFGINYSPVQNRYVANGIGATNRLIYSSDGYTWFGAGFVLSGYVSKIGVSEIILPVITNPTPITGNIVNDLITNTSIINNGTTITVSGSLTVIGDLAIDGAWILTGNSTVNVTGLLRIKGNTTFNSSQPINCETLSISSAIGDSRLEVPLSINLAVGASTTFPMVTYGTRSGRFNTIAIRSSVVVPSTNCPVASQDYSSSTLSVTVTMTRCDPGIENFANQPMSTGVIVGIAVGAVVFASAVILVMILLIKRHRRQQDALSNSRLRQNDINSVHTSKLAPSPGANL